MGSKLGCTIGIQAYAGLLRLNTNKVTHWTLSKKMVSFQVTKWSLGSSVEQEKASMETHWSVDLRHVVMKCKDDCLAKVLMSHLNIYL